MIVSRFLAATAALTVVAAVPLTERLAPTPPSQDAWYHAPDGLDELAAGTILKHRNPPSPIAAFSKVPANLKDAHQILYKTVDTFNSSTATVLTVLVPHNADFSKVLSYQAIVDAAFLDCAPSYALQKDSSSSGLLGAETTQGELLLVEAAMERGWVVILPDYLGSRSAFLANRLSGHAVLDGIRAATQSTSITGIQKDAKFVTWGYSGGSLATGWAAELQHTYGPDLNIIGAALGGTVPRIFDAVNSLNKGLYAGLLPGGLLGLGNEYPKLDKVIKDSLLPEYKPLFDEANHQCLVANLKTFRFKDVLAMVDKPDFLNTEPMSSILEENSMGKQTPKIPLYIYKPVHDEISPVKNTDDLVDSYCADGASVRYDRDHASLHGTLSFTGAAKAFSWLIDIMDGKEAGKGCVTKNVVSTLLSPEAAKVLPKVILDALLDLLKKPIGPEFAEAVAA